MWRETGGWIVMSADPVLTTCSSYVGSINLGIFPPSIFASTCEILCVQLRYSYPVHRPGSQMVSNVLVSSVLFHLRIIVEDIVFLLFFH